MSAEGLAAVPVFLFVGVGFGMFAASSSPVRYYTVIEPTNVIQSAVEGEFQKRAMEKMAE